jgi:hypothetical protein
MKSRPIPELYSSLHQVVMQRIPDECESRLTNLVWLMMGICLSGEVQLNWLVRKLPIRAQKLSLVQRMRRFLDNEAVQVELWYRATALELLTGAGTGGRINLIIDKSKVSGNYQMMMVAVAYRRRSLPIGWTWVKGKRGHSKTTQQLRLLSDIQRLIPAGIKVSLVGDTEFGNPELLAQLERWGWEYALRQGLDTLVQLPDDPTWYRVEHLILGDDHWAWLPQVVLTEVHAYPSALLVYHAPGEKDVWYLATNCPSAFASLRLYRRRMWIEEMFGDMKGQGFDLETSHLRHATRLGRLTLAVCLLYVWLITMGEYVIRHGLAAEVDRVDRRDLSFFRLGWDFVERRVSLYDALPRLFIPSFSLVYGG